MKSRVRTVQRAQRLTLWLGIWVASVVTSQAQEANPVEEGRLARICRYLEEGSVHQVAAAQRQLWEEVGVDDLEALRALLERGRLPAAERALQGRLDALLRQRLGRVEDQIVLFEDARRQVQALQEELAQPSPEGAAEDPAQIELRRSEATQRLAELRRTRNTTRAEIRADVLFLQAQELALAPVVSERLRAGAIESDLVLRFYDDLQGRILGQAQGRFSSAPDLAALRVVERRALVPLAAMLHPADPEGWDRFRESIAQRAIDLLATYAPEDHRAARALFLDLGAWGIERLDRWIAGAEPRVPVELRRLYAEWNRLGVPLELSEHVGLAVASYRSLPLRDREEMLARLEWVGGASAIPVFVRILGLEPELPLQVQAAVSLARLADPRGAEFLRRLGLESAVVLEGISRKVLLIEAIHRREQGDLPGALADLQQILRRFGDDHRIHYELGFTGLQARQLKLAIRHFQRALELDDRDPLAHYNLACAYALDQQPDPALAALERAIERGFRDATHMMQDPDLENLRSLPRFTDLIERLRDS